MAHFESITPQQLNELRQSGQTIDLIDVRIPAAYREAHVEFARNVPFDKLSPEELVKSRNGSESAGDPLYVICQVGRTSLKACDQLSTAGGRPVVNVEGGTSAWEAAGLPVVRSVQTGMSLERQVRIVAGSLVVLGVLLGWFVHPAFYGLSAFVGGGLAFAGITNTCGMAMLLAKLPWNQRTETGAAEKNAHTAGCSTETPPSAGGCCS